MNKYVVTFCLLATFIAGSLQPLLGQEAERKNRNSLGLEIGGVLMLYSLNYERTLLATNYQKIHGRIGVGYFPNFLTSEASEQSVFIPYGVYYLLGKKHHLELGLNARTGFYLKEPTDNSSAIFRAISPSVGYRYQNFSKKSLFFSLGYAYIRQHDEELDEFDVWHWFKLGLGFSF